MPQLLGFVCTCDLMLTQHMFPVKLGMYCDRVKQLWGGWLVITIGRMAHKDRSPGQTGCNPSLALVYLPGCPFPFPGVLVHRVDQLWARQVHRRRIHLPTKHGQRHRQPACGPYRVNRDERLFTSPRHQYGAFVGAASNPHYERGGFLQGPGVASELLVVFSPQRAGAVGPLPFRSTDCQKSIKSEGIHVRCLKVLPSWQNCLSGLGLIAVSIHEGYGPMIAWLRSNDPAARGVLFPPGYERGAYITQT